MIYRFSLAAASLIMMNCQSQKHVHVDTPAPQETAASVTVYLQEGQSKFISDVQMNATFVKLVSDSRCPKGTNCVWQGAGTVSIQLMATTSRPVTFNLSTASMPGKNLSKSFSFNGYTVSLESLTPYPGEKKTAYKAGLKFVKGETEDPSAARPTTR